MYSCNNIEFRCILFADDIDDVRLSVVENRRLVVLLELPFVVPFEERVHIFSNLVRADKTDFQSAFDGFNPSANQQPIDISIRRDFIYEDAYEKLSLDNEATVKPKIRVTMRNTGGLLEAGIDGGGVFREFLLELLKTGFDPNRGLFKLTGGDDKELYPNPQASLVLENSNNHFFFLGRMVGKVGIPISSFFS